MNSYNHYSFGSVVAWLYRSVGGIDTTPDAPGFHMIIIHPHPDEHLTQAHTEYASAYGKITTD
jgi:alpha-L-rhamnosidase